MLTLEDAGVMPAFFTASSTCFVSRGLGENFPVLAIILQVFAAGFDDDVHQVVLLGRRLSG